jgi:hypothetical protein
LKRNWWLSNILSQITNCFLLKRKCYSFGRKNLERNKRKRKERRINTSRRPDCCEIWWLGTEENSDIDFDTLILSVVFRMKIVELLIKKCFLIKIMISVSRGMDILASIHFLQVNHKSSIISRKYFLAYSRYVVIDRRSLYWKWTMSL